MSPQFRFLSVSLHTKCILHFSKVFVFLHLVTESLNWLLCFLKHDSIDLCVHYLHKTPLSATLVASISFSPTQSPLALWQNMQSPFSRNHNSACLFWGMFLKLHVITQQEYGGKWKFIVVSNFFFLALSLFCLRILNYTKCCVITVSDAKMKWGLVGYTVFLFVSL